MCDIMEAIRRRATGAVTREVAEEYVIEDGEERLIRRKVTVKQAPPDMAAAKLLLSLEKPVSLGEEELKREKRRLLEELKSLEEKDGDRKQ